MRPTDITGLTQHVEEAYAKRTPRSYLAHARAREFLPGGDTRSVTYYPPYPTYIERGNGAAIFDLDGNRYLDFLNNYTSLVLGHAHPAVVSAVSHALPNGSIYGVPHIAQADLAERICRRVPGIDRVRFCNSGTEAVMHAVRTARFITGKPMVIKMEGGYHGTADTLEVSVQPDVSQTGPVSRPIPVLENRGIPAGLAAISPVAPFNDAAACEALLEEYHGEVAAVLLEPMMGSAGAIPPHPGYLESLRSLTRKYNCLLIFDEVQTLRFSAGGAQDFYHVIPDITVIGKVIGGGFPIGAFGGTEEVMSIYNPELHGGVSHSGTFNGHPLAMIAGIATLDVLDQPAIDTLNQLAAFLKHGLEQALLRHGLHGQITGAGSIINVHFTPQPVVDYRSAATDSDALTRLLHLMLLERGIFIAKRGMFNISTPMRHADIQAAVEAFGDCLGELQLVIANDLPDLLL